MTDQQTTYKAVKVGDTADWRLTLYLAATGIGAYLRNIEDPTLPAQTLFEEHWHHDDSMLLQRIENAVYDHPQVLDDFSADVVVATPRLLWFPAEVVEDKGDEGCAELFCSVYPGSIDDVLVDDDERIRCAYTLTPGLPAFLRRTFPGARVISALNVLRRRLGSRTSDMPRIFADINDDEVLILAFDKNRFLQGAAHSWRFADDIAYHIMNMAVVCGMDTQQTQLHVSGPRDVRDELMTTMRRHLPYVMQTMLPGFLTNTDMPLPAALVSNRI